MAAAKVSKAAAAILEVVADLIDLLDGDRFDITDVLAAALVTEAATALFVVVALLIDGLIGVSGSLAFTASTLTAGAAAGRLAALFCLVLAGETGVVLAVSETALVAVFAGTVVPEFEAFSSGFRFTGFAGGAFAGLGCFCFSFFLGRETSVIFTVLETAVVAFGALPVVGEVAAHARAISAPAFTTGAFGLVVSLHFGLDVLAEALVAEGAATSVVVVADLVGHVAFAFRIEARVVISVHEAAPVALGALAFLELEALSRGVGRDLDGFTFAVFETALVTITAHTVVSEIAANFRSFGHCEYSIK